MALLLTYHLLFSIFLSQQDQEVNHMDLGSMLAF